jgi:hypothetical protein
MGPNDIVLLCWCALLGLMFDLIVVLGYSHNLLSSNHHPMYITGMVTIRVIALPIILPFTIVGAVLYGIFYVIASILVVVVYHTKALCRCRRKRSSDTQPVPHVAVVIPNPQSF